MCTVKQQRRPPLNQASGRKCKMSRDHNQSRIPAALSYPAGIETIPVAPGVLMMTMPYAAPLTDAVSGAGAVATCLNGKENGGWHHAYPTRKNRCRW